MCFCVAYRSLRWTDKLCVFNGNQLLFQTQWAISVFSSEKTGDADDSTTPFEVNDSKSQYDRGKASITSEKGADSTGFVYIYR